MVDFSKNFDSIKDDFIEHNISITNPGFYDELSFTVIEHSNPDFLNNYARFVQLKTYEPEYIDRARREIPIIANILCDQLKKNGRKGACIDLSGVLMRVLEKERFWNFQIKGSLTIDYPKDSGINRKHFWSIDEGNFSAGHSWVFAPPFKVIDLTIKQQKHRGNEVKYLPEAIVSDSPKLSIPFVEDIVAPHIITYFKRQSISDEELIRKINPVLPRFLEVFQTFEVIYKNVCFKYVPVAISAPDRPFEKMTSMIFSEKKGIEIYEDIIKIELEKARIVQNENIDTR